MISPHLFDLLAGLQYARLPCSKDLRRQVTGSSSHCRW